MKLPLKWLKDYVDYNVTHKEFASKMLLRGFEVADIIPEMKVSNVVVCTITHIEQHPNAERLRVCNIDIGAENELVIVTNATNVYEGCQVPVALDGAILADGTEIKPTKMRGVLSSGMFCGGAELGINDVEYEGAGADSVLILNDGTKYTNGMRGLTMSFSILNSRPTAPIVKALSASAARLRVLSVRNSTNLSSNPLPAAAVRRIMQRSPCSIPTFARAIAQGL